MPKEEFEIKKDIFLSRLKLTEEQIEQIEKEWHLHRKKRLTASYFGKICKLRVKTSRAKTVLIILYGSFSGNNTTKYGTQNEENTKSALSGILNKTIDRTSENKNKQHTISFIEQSSAPKKRKIAIKDSTFDRNI
ncbi:hypothetical protein QTP88_014044 [Uroleucon formosanum]